MRYEEVILDPAAFYKTPDILLQDKSFDTSQKVKLLRAWELDVRLLQVSDDENMGTPQEISLLGAIHRALTELQGTSQKVS